MQHHFKNRQTKSFYAGRVIDGPFEGDWIESDELFIMKYIGPPPVTAAPWEGNAKTLFIDRVYYKFLRSYRAWAWVQQ